MELTLNQVIKRLETLALAHRQINHFFIGNIDEFLNDQDVQYPAIFCEVKPGSVSKTMKRTVYNFTFYFLDLLAISSESLRNEWEVKSDMMSVAQDYLAMMFYTEYQDSWYPTGENGMELHDFKLHDLCAGCSVNIGIGVRFSANRCQVPVDGIEFETDNTDTMVQIYTYTGAGTEGDSLTVGTLVGKKILMAFKGDKSLEVITAGTPTNEQLKYTAPTGNLTFGNDIEQGQFIQILWRNLG